MPVQVSATSHAPVSGRQIAPALPTGCWQAVLTPLHWSRVQALPSDGQAVPFGLTPSAGQFGELPGQFSCASQLSTAPRHMVDGFAKPSGGQLLPPLHDSATSQTPFCGRHTAMLLASLGQSLLTPSHISATSQTPAAGRHTKPFGCGTSGGHTALVPVQVSLKSHSIPALAARHTTVFDAKVSVGHVGLLPLQVSATSQTLAAGRHSSPFGRIVQ